MSSLWWTGYGRRETDIRTFRLAILGALSVFVHRAAVKGSNQHPLAAPEEAEAGGG